jgi:hypothetical protein
MSERVGKLVKCDRCGKETFLQYKGTDKLDGGFTRVDNFEALPNFWAENIKCFPAGDGHTLKTGCLCDECYQMLYETMQEFMRYAVAEEE